MVHAEPRSMCMHQALSTISDNLRIFSTRQYAILRGVFITINEPMKNGSMITHLALWTVCLSTCAGSALAQAEKSLVPKLTQMSLEQVADLVVKEEKQLQSAYILVSQRPAVKQEIAEFEYEITSEDKQGKTNSIVQFSSLPGGLEYWKHSHPDFVEASIDIYGVTSVLYWNSRFPFPFDLGLAQLTLTKGQIFSNDSSFAVETKSFGISSTTTCQYMNTIAADTIHEKLTGTAAVFHCTSDTDPDGKSKLWYLADYARYVSFEAYSGTDLLTALRIKDVKFR